MVAATSMVEYDGFYGATRARQIALGQASGNNDILAEINLLQTGIDGAASTGNLSYTNNTSPMATSADFFNAFNDPFNNDTSADELRRLAMQQVINYFTRLGYNINRNRVGTTNSFEWVIKW